MKRINKVEIENFSGEVATEVAAYMAAQPRVEVLMQDGVTAPPVPIENEARSDWLFSG